MNENPSDHDYQAIVLKRDHANNTGISRVVPLTFLVYLMDVVWGSISLHGWIYISSGVAISQVFSYGIRRSRRCFAPH